MIPLSTMWTRSVQSGWGCALRSEGLPCVAQRVWPMPVVASEIWSRDRRAAVRLARVHGLTQPAEVADRPHRLEPAVDDERQAGRVIAPVLEALESVHQELAARALAYISDDAAHNALLYFRVGASFNRKEPPPCGSLPSTGRD